MEKMDPLVTILLTKDALEEMQSAKVEPGWLEELRAWPCDTLQDEADLGDFLTNIQARLTSLEAARLTVAEPLTKATSALNAMFRGTRAPFEEAKGIIKDKLEAAITERDRVRMEALALSAQYVKEGATDEVVTALAVAADHAPVKPSGHGTTKEWTWELEDIALVPPEYLALNAPAMTMYAKRFRNSDTISPIPGVKWIRKSKVIARGS